MRALKNLMFFKCGYPQSKKIVNEAEVFSFINYFYLVIYIITRIFLSQYLQYSFNIFKISFLLFITLGILIWLFETPFDIKYLFI